MSSFNPLSLRKYFIMGSQNVKGNPVAVLEQAIQAGITIFQFREKGPGSLSGDSKIKLGKELRAVCSVHQIPFIVNDDVELVDKLDADGIHVGQDDQSVKELREMFPNKIIGLSVSNQDELNNSALEYVDYIGAGPVFLTTTKVDAKSSVGLDWIRFLRAEFPEFPIVGIGGINTTNASSVLKAGANGVSFISAVTRAEDIKEAVSKL
ncbi:thiamine phosphate synthase [Oceanobacillus indicireducens]|uniref:Thiamine-phosphate synthase n=1 Tax=Oceanobacillus indicireducens TaxID=1004261 RepID=A0A917Y0A1_9BACI|nr:thiamine phosphate synthase [Oceanobacillus indicireducens]GGN59237.1 thiamine-phosphate synthase [Oceanobacillus indicireducens]